MISDDGIVIIWSLNNSMSFFFFTDESIEVDPNYDPSDFLLAVLPSREIKEDNKIQDDLAISESDEDIDMKPDIKTEMQQPPADEDVGGDLWF